MIKRLLRRLFKFTTYLAATIVILLAIALGLFRLFLPRLPEYQEDIKSWASAAIRMEVKFSGMNARWGLRGPEVEFYGAELISLETQRRIVAAEKVSVGIGLTRFLTDRKAVVDRLVVSETTIEIQQLENGEWWIQGGPPDELFPKRSDNSGGGEVPRIEVIGEDLRIRLLQPGDEQPRRFKIPRLLLSRDDVRLAIDANVELPGDLGESVNINAIQMLANQTDKTAWDVTIELGDIELASLSTLHSADAARFSSGVADARVSLRVSASGVSRVLAEVDFDQVAVGSAAMFSVDGRFEFLRDDSGWLVAADDFRLETENGLWPLSTLRVEAGTEDGKIDSLDVRASYLRLDDASVLRPWLKPEQQQQLEDFSPDGVLRNVKIVLSDVDSESPRFDVAAQLERIGVAASGAFPGVRGFSGVLRSDVTGGLFEINSDDLSVNVPNYLPEAVVLDELKGTLIWRRSNSRTTVLSDNIAFRNADFSFESNVELTLEDGSRRPVVDLATSWSISDIAVARKYVPYLPRIPRTSEWFQEGLLGGRISGGTLTLNGPLEKWPFDDGEGRLLVKAKVQDATIMYQRGWPVVEVEELDIVVDNMRLYTERNVVVNAGNKVRDAKVEISDFRNAVLTVNAHSAGPLANVRDLLANSPLGKDVFKGNLERVTVAGDGAFDLDLRIPIRDFQNFEFNTQLEMHGASMQLEGFPAALTELTGRVTIGRDKISSEALVGTFLGGPASVDLRPAPDTMPDYRIIASVNGSATADGLINELQLPLTDALTGATEFDAQLFFVRDQDEGNKPFRIELSSTLAGISIDLPPPFNKVVDVALPLAASIEMPSPLQTITSTGTADGLLSWQMEFKKTQERWDIDRGVLAFGEEPVTDAEIRGLHLRGQVDVVQMQQWFDRMRRMDSRTGMGDRIRSVDMQVGNLYLFGQHIVDHRVQLDRSAEEWLLQFEGPEITGSAFVPYDFTAGRPLMIDMSRLVLPGDEADLNAAQSQIDPRSLPPITIKADEFAIGTRFLGALSATMERTPDGLESSDLLAKDASFEIVGNGRWVVDEADPAGSHSYLLATLTSTDVGATMTRLGYDPGIVSDDLSMTYDLDWSGGPRNDFRETLNGSAVVRVGTGQLSDVEPGAGRMMGLMSVVALPRRLSLDFRDVFGKGFGFDTIRGRFTLVDGQTYTCNLSLEGPAAQIAVVGRAGLVDRDYDQSAAVSASVGNALPVVGAALGGPTVAAVVLIFSQIFKKPLSEVGQVYYGISGSWDEPTIESVTGEEFAEHGVRAGCIDEAN